MRRGKLALLLPLTPLLLGGCGSTGATPRAIPSAAASPWMISYTGNAVPSPAPTMSYSLPAPFPSGFLPVGTAAPAGAAPSGNGCPDIKFHPGAVNSAGVLAGSTSATVSWYNPGGADLVEYRVTAISQNLKTGGQRDIGWTVIKPGTGCGMLSAPITGLDRKTSYVFSVDAVFTKIGEDGTWSATVARSIPTKTG